MMLPWRIVEINGGSVKAPANDGSKQWRFSLPAVNHGYADAQIDDYGGRRRKNYPWQPGTRMQVRARFSHDNPALAGTAGFGFWNAPFGPGTGPLPALPQAVWFFYASPRNDLPLAPAGQEGKGWFAATVDATTPRALAWAPLAPLVLLLNQLPSLRRRLWPQVRRSLAISFERLAVDLRDWHHYELDWLPHGCFFRVDGRPLLQTSFSPRGPLGFVAWMDNQYMVATPTGRFRWGTENVHHPQWLALDELALTQH